MIDWNDLDSIKIARRHDCPVCGRTHYIGKYEELSTWECIVYTAQHMKIAQCKYCGGLIEIYARGDERGKNET